MISLPSRPLFRIAKHRGRDQKQVESYPSWLHPDPVLEKRPSVEEKVLPTPLGRSVIRKALVMRINPGQELEYQRRHQPIWPELEKTFREHGVLTYSIFLDPGSLQLFAYLEVESEEKWELVSQTAICREWWAYMKDLMPCHPDNRPVSCEMREVFHIENGDGQ